MKLFGMMEEITGKIKGAEESLRLELYVALLLASLRESDEVIKSSSSPLDVPFDIEIKNGLRKLNLPPNSYVEVKKNLMFNAFEFVNHQTIEARRYNPEIQGVLVVYQQTNFQQTLVNQYARHLTLQLGVKISVISLDELRLLVLKESGSSNINTSFPENKQTWEEQRDKVIDVAKEAIKHNKITLFLGAGVSVDAGMVSWDGLLKSLINQKGHSAITKHDMNVVKDVNFNSSLIIGRYIKCADSTLDIPTSVQKVLYNNVHQSNLVDSLCKFIDSGSIESVITYNYDMLVENRMSNITPATTVKVAPVYGNNRIDKRCVPVYHVHGIVPDPSSGSLLKPDIVLTEDSYHELYLNSYDWSNIEQLHALDRNVCVFVGLSMSDPNLRRLLDFSHTKQAEDKPYHFVFLQRKQFSPSKHPYPKKDEANWRTLEIMLSNLGLNVIWYKKHSDLPGLIDRLH